MGACVSARAQEEFPSFHSSYTFGAQLGKGSFGSVFLAEKKITGEAHAVKVQKGREAGDDNIKYEATLWQQLHHTNCVRFIGLFQEADVFFAVMEQCHCSLWHRLVDAPKWSVTELIWDIKQMLKGIQYMHLSQIVHRDIKPKNILYGGPDSKTLKIADFGLAHHFGEGASKTLVNICGTAAYMAPEMLAGKGYTYSVDMWSFGVVCYMILLGRVPFGRYDMTSAEMKQAILEVEEEPRRLTHLSEQLQTKLELINRASSDEPDAEERAMILGAVPGQHAEGFRRARMSARALITKRLAAVDFVRELLHRDVEQRSNVYQALNSDFLSNHHDDNPLFVYSLTAFVKSLMIVTRKPYRSEEDSIEEQRKAEAKAIPVEIGLRRGLPEPGFEEACQNLRRRQLQAPGRMLPQAQLPPPGQPAEVPTSPGSRVVSPHLEFMDDLHYRPLIQKYSK
ncbi:unnamed protein product [Polarella glacialis]|uniref:Protein kinase domain-containing protein n=1 Tax=Polarella glacialis TaxID=89957 RepID=A0A813FDC7_POLGL|nr:unnamed protein product [Polarella glacialis]